LIGARHRGQIKWTVGLRLLRLLVAITMPAARTLKPAPTPIIKTGISTSHMSGVEVVVVVAVAELEVVCVLVSLVAVVLLVDVVTEVVVVSGRYLAARVSVSVTVGDVKSARIARESKTSELAPERPVVVRTISEAPSTHVRHGRGDMTFSVACNGQNGEKALSNSSETRLGFLGF